MYTLFYTYLTIITAVLTYSVSSRSAYSGLASRHSLLKHNRVDALLPRTPMIRMMSLRDTPQKVADIHFCRTQMTKDLLGECAAADELTRQPALGAEEWWHRLMVRNEKMLKLVEQVYKETEQEISRSSSNLSGWEQSSLDYYRKSIDRVKKTAEITMANKHLSPGTREFWQFLIDSANEQMKWSEDNKEKARSNLKSSLPQPIQEVWQAEEKASSETIESFKENIKRYEMEKIMAMTSKLGESTEKESLLQGHKSSSSNVSKAFSPSTYSLRSFASDGRKERIQYYISKFAIHEGR